MFNERHLQAEAIMLEGDPATLIVEYAGDWAADLVVVGSGGRSRLEHMLLGSVSATVVAKAPCPVLVVKHRRHGKQ